MRIKWASVCDIRCKVSCSDIVLTKLNISERKGQGQAASEPWTCVYWPSSTYVRLALTSARALMVGFGLAPSVAPHWTPHWPGWSHTESRHVGAGHWSGRDSWCGESDLLVPGNRSEHPWNLPPLCVSCVCYHQVFKQQNIISRCTHNKTSSQNKFSLSFKQTHTHHLNYSPIKEFYKMFYANFFLYNV